MPVFSVESMSCLRGERQVISGLSVSIPTGGALILRGANGAGKSTLLRVMAGLLRPSQGQIRWDDFDLADDPARHFKRTVYIGHADAVKPTLSVRENIAFWSDISGNAGAPPAEAMNALNISHLADLPAQYLSAGQRRRVALCRMLTSGATLWLLDEPTTALDADAITALAELLVDHRAKGGMICVSTHSDMGLKDAETHVLGAQT